MSIHTYMHAYMYIYIYAYTYRSVHTYVYYVCTCRAYSLHGYKLHMQMWPQVTYIKRFVCATGAAEECLDSGLKNVGM